MRAEFKTIMVVPERHKQLEAIAARHGVTLTEAVERAINHTIAAGDLDPGIPGVLAEPSPAGGVCIWFEKEGMGWPGIAPHIARALASALDFAADTPGRGREIDLGHATVKVGRIGRGVGIIFENREGVTNTGKKVLTVQLARDLARLIHDAAGAAEANSQ